MCHTPHRHSVIHPVVNEEYNTRNQLAANQLSRALFRTNTREQRVAPNPCGLSKIHDRNISTLSNACVPRSGYPFVRQGFLRLSILSEWRTCRLWICHRNLCYVLCHKSGCASIDALWSDQIAEYIKSTLYDDIPSTFFFSILCSSYWRSPIIF